MSSPLFSVGGLASGLDTTTIISQLVQLEGRNLSVISATKSKLQAQQSAWGKVSSALTTFSSALADLQTASRIAPPKLTSSSDAVRVSGSMVPGTRLDVSVSQLATSGQYALQGFSTPTDLVGAGRIVLGTGLGALGIGRVTGASGSGSVSVTTATGAATVSADVGATRTLTAATTLDVTTSAGTTSLTVAAGTYTTTELAAALTGAAQSAGAQVAFTASGATLTAASRDEGSAATVTVGGAGASAIGLTGSGTGTDGEVAVDGVTYAVTHAGAGVTTTAGSVTLELNGGLRSGSGAFRVVETTASTTLADLAKTLGAADSPLSAAVVALTPGAGGTELLLTSKATGTAGAVSIDVDIAGRAPASTLRAGQDAVFSLGAQQVTRSSNTVDDLVAGLSLTLTAVTTTPAVVTSEVGSADLVEKVKKLVSTYNAAYDTAATAAKVDAGGDNDGPLQGDSTLRSLMNGLARTVTDLAGTSADYRSLSSIGVRLGRDGRLTLDEAALTTAVTKDLTGVTSLLARTGSTSDARLTFVTAGVDTAPGPRDVVVTRAASQASVTGASFATLAAAETLTVTVGTTSLTWTAGAGMTPEALASGLTSALRSAGLTASASVSGGAVTLRSDGYGSLASVAVTSTGSGSGLGGTSAVGVDIAGTVDGVAATGSGQTLTTSDGLLLRAAVTAADLTAAGGSLALPTLTYSLGAAGALSRLVTTATKVGGTIATRKDGLTASITDQDKRTEALNRHLELYRSTLEKQFAALETALQRLHTSMPDFSSLANLNP